jgi:hypothetical protein
MSVTDQINILNEQCNTQAGLIEQIQAALEGKAGGGGGASIPTCTIKIINECTNLGCYLLMWHFLQFIDGEIIATHYDNTDAGIGNISLIDINAQEIILENIVCGSYADFACEGYSFSYCSITNESYLIGEGSKSVAFITATEANSVCTVRIIDDD